MDPADPDIDMNGKDPAVVTNLITFFYTGEYPIVRHSPFEEVKMCAKMFHVADQYQLPSLSNLAIAHLKHACRAAFDPTVAGTLVADKSGLLCLVAAANDAYAMTPGVNYALRAAVVRLMKPHIPQFTTDTLGKEPFDKSRYTTPELFFDLVMSSGEKSPSGADEDLGEE